MRPTTVLNGRDYEAINMLLEIHCAVKNPLILDCTYNTGKMWKKSDFKPIRMDISREMIVDTIGDFTQIPFVDKSFDVVVFDPPHLPSNACSENSSKIWEKNYGITKELKYRSGDNVSPLFSPFVLEAKRILKNEGIILAKIADLVHNHKYQWQTIEFYNACVANGLTPCDLLIKCDPSAGNLMSSKWVNVKHLRKAHCFWYVVRINGRCERK